MTKQEEVMQTITDFCWWLEVDDFKTKEELNSYIRKELIPTLSSKGVVLKVNALNTTDFIKCPCEECTAEYKLIDEWGYLCDLTCQKRSQWINRCRGAEEAKEAGCEAVESLIEDE